MENRSIDVDEFLRGFQTQHRPEVDLNALRSGDILVVATANTLYRIVMDDMRCGTMSTNHAKRPVGAVQLMGGTFGHSSTIKPDGVFCGGGLEYLHCASKKIHVTTAIRALWLANRLPQDSASPPP